MESERGAGAGRKSNRGRKSEGGASRRRAEQGPCHRVLGIESQVWAGAVPMDKVGLEIIFGETFGEIVKCLYLNIYLDDY